MRIRLRALVPMAMLLNPAMAVMQGQTVQAAAPAVRIVAQMGLGGYGGGVAALADRYVFAGTSSHLAMDVLDQRSNRLAATLQVPGLAGYGYGALNMEMAALALSPDNRTLYVLNQLRQDIAVFDTTGNSAPRAIKIGEDHGYQLTVSPDGRYLGVMGLRGGTVVNAHTGTLVGVVKWAKAMTWGRDGTFYVLSVEGSRALVAAYDTAGHKPRILALPAPDAGAAPAGALALSPDQSTLYVLWSGLRALSLPSGRITATLHLPATPTYMGMAVAPNGKQATLWAPHASDTWSTPDTNPNYVISTSILTGGGIQPVTLPSLQPAPNSAALRTLSTPFQVAYSGDSARAYVTTLTKLAVLATGTSGSDRQPVPPVSLQKMMTGPVLNCSTWNIGGNWSFTALPGAPLGTGTGPATLIQNGETLSGSIAMSSAVHYNLSGTIQKSFVRLTLSTPGLVDSSFSGTVQPDGKSIMGDVGIFRGSASCGTGHGSLPTQPSITVSRVGLFHDVQGTPQWATTVATEERVNFAAYYQASNGGTAAPSGQISLTFGGKTVYTGAMEAHQESNGARYFLAGITFHSAGSYTAQITLKLGSASVTRTLNFMVTAGSTQPSSTPVPQPTQTGPCQSWNLSGSWSFSAAPTSEIGTGTGTATLTQSGGTVTGTLMLAGTTFTVNGTVSGTTVTLTLSAPGLIGSTYNGTVGADGKTISGNLGTFQGSASCG